MVVELLEQFFLKPLGLIALVSIIPLIIIYLIKEKPKIQFFPSVKFLMKKKKHRFMPNVSKLIKDPLFVVQLLAVILLSAGLAQPYINVNENMASKNVLIILDASASMQTVHDGISRFDAAKSIAMENIGDTTTIILVSEFPEILGENIDSRQTRRLLETAKPKDTTTNLYDAIILADDFVDSGDVVLVISDFIHTTNDKDTRAAIDVIRSKGIKVILKNVMKESSNIGIVDLEVKTNSTSVRVKSYNNATISGKLSVGSNSIDITLEPLQSDVFRLTTFPGTSEINLDVKDDFFLDNKVYVSRPLQGEIRVLYITNHRDLFLYTAISLIEGVKIDIAEPPVINSYEYDIFVVKNVESEKIVQSIVQNLDDRIKAGSSLIISGSDAANFQDLLGYSPIEKNLDAKVPVVAIDSAITKDIDFGSTKTYFTSANQGVLAQVDQDAVITLTKKGAGNILFYGPVDEGSTFQYELFYPVFWKRLITQFVSREDIKSLNIKTGSIITTDSNVVTDPDGNQLDSKSLIAEEVGFYRFPEKNVASNLIDEKESDVNGLFVEPESIEAPVEQQQKQMPMEITIYVLTIAALLVLIELFYIKFRGDL